jgi:hypothetical protein
LKGFVAKDKSIRFRVLQMVAEMVSHLGEIECVFSLIYVALSLDPPQRGHLQRTPCCSYRTRQ